MRTAHIGESDCDANNRKAFDYQYFAKLNPRQLGETCMNESRTCANSGTNLTQRCSPDVLRDLLVKRNLVGAKTRKDRLISNMIEQSKWLNDETRDRSWAVHPTQDIRWWMNVQFEALARGKT